MQDIGYPIIEVLRSQTGWNGNPEIIRSQDHPWKLKQGELSLISLTQKMW